MRMAETHQGGDPNRQKKRSPVLIATCVAFGTVLLLLYLYFDPANPDYGRWFPKCMLHTLTGLSCPSCGSQRAFHALLSGDLAGALRQNWFLFFSLLYLAALTAAPFLRGRHPRLHHFLYGRAALIYVGIYLLWFAVRNLLGV